MSPTDPRMLSTLDERWNIWFRIAWCIDIKLAKGPLMVWRVKKGPFRCARSGWVECLSRAGRLREARLIFEKMLSYANHLVFYAEQVGASGESLGNFPQAFTHMGLISAAYNLDRWLGASG